jgi:tetratricopeptide (TPR) repeat protein
VIDPSKNFVGTTKPKYSSAGVKSQYHLTMIKLTPWAIGLLLIASIAPSTKAAVNAEIQPSQRPVDRYAQNSPCGFGIPQAMCYDMHRRRLEQEQKEREAQARKTPQQIKQEQEAARQKEQARAQLENERRRFIVRELESKGDYLNLGTFKEEYGDFAGAIAAYNRAIAVNQKPNVAYFQRAKAREKQKDFSGAMADYNQAIVINPQNMAAYFGRSELKKKLNDQAGATQDFNRAMQLIKDALGEAGKDIQIPTN